MYVTDYQTEVFIFLTDQDNLMYSRPYVSDHFRLRTSVQ